VAVTRDDLPRGHAVRMRRTSSTAARELAARVRSGDVVLILGAGDIRPVGERLLALLAAGSPA